MIPYCDVASQRSSEPGDPGGAPVRDNPHCAATMRDHLDAVKGDATYATHIEGYLTYVVCNQEAGSGWPGGGYRRAPSGRGAQRW